MSENSQGRERPRCGAKKRQGEGTCKRPAGWGTDHVGIGACRLHGGNWPTHKKKAQREVARREAEALGGRRDILPAEALLELVQRKAAEVEYWTRRVRELEDQGDSLVWGVTKSTDESGRTKEAKPNVALEMMHEAERDLERFSSAAMRAGLEEALVRSAAIQGAAIVEAIRHAVDRARATDDPADQILLELLPAQSSAR